VSGAATRTKRAAKPVTRRLAPDLAFEDLSTDAATRSPAFAGHESVLRARDAATGLDAIVAVHDRSLGPAAGPCRMAPYRVRADAVDCALRLSRTITRQAALYDLSLGGAAVVLIGNPRTGRTPALFRMLGRFADRLSGGLILTSDLGVSAQDLDFAAMETPFVIGATPGGGGDSSIATAYGVLVGMQAAVRHRLGRDRIAGLTVAIQGAGRVGYALATLLRHDGARILIADADEADLGRAVVDLGAEPVATDAIHGAPADVFAPCAVGGTLNARTIPELAATIVAGSAHGQCARAEDADGLRRRGILHVPELALAAGGLINAACELDRDGYDRTIALSRVARVGQEVAAILAAADAEGLAPSAIAEARADARWAARHRRLRLATRTPAWAHG
jgi:leucine dehydrogenase